MIYEYVSLIAYEGLGFKLREGEDVLYTLPTEQFGLPKSYGRKVKAKVLTVSPNGLRNRRTGSTCLWCPYHPARMVAATGPQKRYIGTG